LSDLRIKRNELCCFEAIQKSKIVHLFTYINHNNIALPKTENGPIPPINDDKKDENNIPSMFPNTIITLFYNYILYLIITYLLKNSNKI